jgi:Cyclic nucleotide-binding domain
MSSTFVQPISPDLNLSDATRAKCFQGLMSTLGSADSHVYPSGIELFRQDSTPGHVYFVEAGVVKLTRCEKNGAEFILDIRFPGSILGSEAAIRRMPHPFSAVTNIVPANAPLCTTLP